ncbi:MAG: AAA family ATPase [Planctomycetota bacterium]
MSTAPDMGAGAAPRRFARGLCLGKFLPVHAGHLHLVRFALRWVDTLDVVVESVAGEAIPHARRVEWMRELAYGARVHALAGHHPQAPHEHPDFWRYWSEVLVDALGAAPDAVFASEDYGAPLAAALGATFVPVDPLREGVDVSGTRVRADPLAYFDRLPPPVRAWYSKRVAIVGPESTGKSTLASTLGARCDAVVVPEYARTYLEARQRSGLRDLSPDDMEAITLGQLASDASLARTSRGVLVSDTDLITTQVWSERLFGTSADWLRAEAAAQRFDLTLLLAPDVPWVRDPVRYLPGEGRDFFDRLERALRAAGRDFTVLSGSFAARTEAASAAVARLTRGATDAAPVERDGQATP